MVVKPDMVGPRSPAPAGAKFSRDRAGAPERLSQSCRQHGEPDAQGGASSGHDGVTPNTPQSSTEADFKNRTPADFKNRFNF